MSWGKQFARRRLVYLALSVLLPIVVIQLARLLPLGNNMLAAIFLAALLTGPAFFIWTLFAWSPRCPKCAGKRAKSQNRDGREFIVCRKCGYEDATGWIFGGGGG